MEQKTVKLEEAGSGLAQLLGDNCRKRRKALAFSQAELSERVGIGAPHLSYIENGKGNPTLEVVESLAAGLGCSVLDLLRPDSEAKIQG